jgi:hypothetical protein
MIELTVRLDEIDYDSLAEYLVPLFADKIDRGGILGGMLSKNKGMATGIVKTILSKMTQEQRDRLVAEQLTKNREKLLKAANEAAARQGIRGKVTGFDVANK